MRIVFIGCVEFSASALERLLSLGADIVGICTLQASTFNSDHVDLSAIANRVGIPSIYSPDINSKESIDWIKEKSPDIIFCFGWSKLLGSDLLGLSSRGVIGFHPAALPDNRGRHPLIWALVLGLTKTASTFFLMDGGADTGDILSQEVVLIDSVDDARSLYDKVTQTALSQIEYFLPLLSSGEIEFQKQNISAGNTWRKRTKADGVIDWRMSAEVIHNLVRALTRPYVGAHFVCGGREFKTWKTSVFKDAPVNIEPGRVIGKVDEHPIIKCGQDAICLLDIDPAFHFEVGQCI